MSEIVYTDDDSKMVLIEDVNDIAQYLDDDDSLIKKVTSFYTSYEDDGNFYIIYLNRSLRYFIFEDDSNHNPDYFDEVLSKVSATSFKVNLRTMKLNGLLKYINENIQSDDNDLYYDLTKLSKGMSVNTYTMRLYNDNIYEVKMSDKNPKRTIITLKFDDEEFFDMLNLGDDEKYFINSVYSHYGSQWSERVDLDDEWYEGYIWRQFTDKNLDKVQKIIENNGEGELYAKNVYDNEHKICKILRDLYPDEVDSITREYGYSLDSKSDEIAKADIEKHYCNPLFKYGIIMVYCMSRYLISAVKLKQIYDIVGIPELSIVEVLKTYFTEIRNIDFDYNLAEYSSYDYQSIDREAFNRSISGILDKMVEDSESEMDEDSEKIKSIIKKYGLRQKNTTPKGTFDIISFDLQDGTIDYRFSKDKSYVDYNAERRRANYDEFMTFLNNYELFENKVIKLLKQLNEQEEIDKDIQLTIDFLKSIPPVKSKTPLQHLKDEINNYNIKNSSNLDLSTILKLSQKNEIPFKIDLFGLQVGDKQKIISTLNYDLNKNVTFTLTHNAVWGKNLIGVNANF